LPRQTRAIQEKESTRKRTTSVEDGNSTDEKNKAERTKAALSTKGITKSNGPPKHGISNAGRRNSSAEDRKSADCKGKDPAEDKGNKDAPMQEMEMARNAIATLATTKESARRDRSLKVPTRSEGVEGTGQGRKDSLEKRTLFASQTKEALESLRYPESKRSTSEDNVTQKETEQAMAKGCIGTVDDDE